MPSELEEEDEDIHIHVAKEAMEDENRRTRAGFGGGGVGGDPSASSSSKPVLDDRDVKSLRKRFSFLKDFSDNFIRNTPYEALLKTETSAIKLDEYEKSKAAAVRLAANRDKIRSSFTVLKEGKDNRWDVLHKGRFLAGAGCSASKMWLAARNSIGIKGQLPISTYDMNSVGLGGYVSKKGWIELHDAGSESLSLKLFNINSCGNKSSQLSNDKLDQEAKDIVDLGEFKLALRVAREAQSFVQPWNKSISAIEGFMQQTNFCNKDLANVDKPAALLTQFTDYVMGENANRWRAHESFLSTGDLKASWDSFFGAKPVSSLRQDQKKQQKFGKGQSNSPFSRYPGFFDDICYNYNVGRCVKPPGACFTRTGVQLRHVCNFRADVNKPKDVCGKPHPRALNH